MKTPTAIRRNRFSSAIHPLGILIFLVTTGGVSAEAAKDGTLRNCNGCGAGIALQLGAERSLIGVVTRGRCQQLKFLLSGSQPIRLARRRFRI
jgi:hypothetical protein